MFHSLPIQSPKFIISKRKNSCELVQIKKYLKGRKKKNEESLVQAITTERWHVVRTRGIYTWWVLMNPPPFLCSSRSPLGEAYTCNNVLRVASVCNAPHRAGSSGWLCKSPSRIYSRVRAAKHRDRCSTREEGPLRRFIIAKATKRDVTVC